GILRNRARVLSRLGQSRLQIIAAARRIDRLDSLCNDINSKGIRRAFTLELDVMSNGATIEGAVQRAWDAFGRINVLINNAGIRGSVSSPLELAEEEWEHTFKTNLRGAWLLSKYVCRRMRDAKQGGGSAINISSVSGLNRVLVPGGLAYASSKMALDMLTRRRNGNIPLRRISEGHGVCPNMSVDACAMLNRVEDQLLISPQFLMMALELGVYKVRVNSIAPGIFKSEITERLIQKERFHNFVFRTFPLRDLETTDPAITSVVRYLIHSSSEYVSGNIFIVDSGRSSTGVPIFSSF
ncbi:hypothetical protein H5410_058838, partial [Solanum commersonii]